MSISTSTVVIVTVRLNIQKKLHQMLRGASVVIDTARSGEEYARGKPSGEYVTLVKKGKEIVVNIKILVYADLRKV